MSFRTQDDAALLFEFLSWLTHQPDRDKLTDSELVLRFIEQRAESHSQEQGATTK